MKPRNIPSLDGLRAVSVLLVLASHMNGVLAQKLPFIPFWLYVFWGALGVQTFFVISGFLITHLLLKELNTTGTVNLKRFYFRRAMRIFPPFYVYLAVALSLTLAGFFPGELRAFLVAGTYTWNYLGTGSELVEHTWSLSLEEQFYLLWPAALVFLGARKSVKLAVCVILLSPVSRIVTYYLFPTSAHSSTRCCILASTASCSAAFWQCFGVIRGSTSSFNPCFAAGWRPLPPHSHSFSVLFFSVSFPGFVHPGFRVYAQRTLSLADTALRCANSPVPRGQAAEHSRAAPSGRHLIQPLLVAATIYPRKFCALCSMESPRNSDMRRDVVLVVERPSFWLRDRLEQALSSKRTIAVEPARG